MNRPRKWRVKATDWVLILICLLYMIQYSDRVNISTAAGAIAKEMHLSNTELGFVFSAFAYPYAIVQLFGGWLGDKIGPRRMLTIFGLIVASACILTSFASSLVSLAICRFQWRADRHRRRRSEIAQHDSAGGHRPRQSHRRRLRYRRLALR